MRILVAALFVIACASAVCAAPGVLDVLQRPLDAVGIKLPLPQKGLPLGFHVQNAHPRAARSPLLFEKNGPLNQLLDTASSALGSLGGK
ncbi:hypothetical protein ONE63_010328 [Megalurothrips usitatus]|uniref:Secreted protein n=1 Tax=Megalurothrips usitatus TaxID=439358 RepID=A0AAV7XLP7_9NEOP|nr:hypothetical protein ONE63_010328 [Megalurothrips usitatus]